MSDYDTAWLIEIPGAHPAWWDGRATNTFTRDANDAVRFSRRSDAERVLGWKVVLPPPGEVVITEHQWLTLPSPSPARMDTCGGLADTCDGCTDCSK